MNPYEAPQTVALTIRRSWPQVPQHWRENLFAAAVGMGFGFVENYYREQERQLERAELVQQVRQQVQFQKPESP